MLSWGSYSKLLITNIYIVRILPDVLKKRKISQITYIHARARVYLVYFSIVLKFFGLSDWHAKRDSLLALFNGERKIFFIQNPSFAQK